jgi:hypothetical protein
MFRKTYYDYKCYLNDKNCNQCYKQLKTQIDSLDYKIKLMEFNNEYNLNQTIYNSESSNNSSISILFTNTFIVKPLDQIEININTQYILDSNQNIKNGFIKRIINKCDIFKENQIRILCINENNVGGFNNNGINFKYYYIPVNGDILELVWSTYNNCWCVEKYGGRFSNN